LGDALPARSGATWSVIWCKMTVMLQSGLDIGSNVIPHRVIWDQFEGGAAMRSGNSGKVALSFEGI